METNLQLLPKRPYPLKSNAFPNKARLMTNHYYFTLKNTTDLYQFSLDTQPPINDDSIQVLRDFVNSFKEILTNEIGFVCHKGKTIWGIKPLQKPLNLSRKMKEITYEIIIKQNRVFYETEIVKLEGLALRSILQVYSVALKQKLVKMGLKEIARGRYFRVKSSPIEEMVMTQIGIKALRTYQLRLVPLMRCISLQIDVGTRILRTENFLQTLNNCSSLSQKKGFIGQSVECNYGNRNTYKIIDIDFTKTPISQFTQEKIQMQISYLRYYEQQYKIKIMQKKQPLIKVILRKTQIVKQGKVKKEPIEGYLVPQLVRLVGIPQQYSKNQFIMRKIADFTKIPPTKRCQYSQDIADQFNAEKGYMRIQNPIQAEGFILPNPTFITSSQRSTENGNINIKDKLKEPMKLKQGSWLFVFSTISEDYRDDIDDAEDIVKGFKEAQKAYGINIQSPKFVEIRKDNLDEWKKQISKNYNDNAIIVLFFTNRQSRYYDELKKYLTNEIKVPSQVVLRKQLKSKGALSVFSKIICQMNAKVGKALWAIPPKHPFWKQKTIVIGGLSISKGKHGHTLAFVGTYSRDLTKTYGNSFTKLPSRENIAQKIYQDLFIDWIKKYQEFQKVMPSIIILYREGLSDQQVEIQGQKQLQGLNCVIARANKKFVGYNPQIIYIVVNKRVKSRFYSSENKNNNRGGKFRPLIENPCPGSIVFQPLSTENAYDFHLAAQKVTQGTCNLTHYRIAYDSSKIPQEAIAQLTYEQCYNYYNWFGAVRVPSCLQSADKLSRFVGEHMKENIASSPLLKTPFYL